MKLLSITVIMLLHARFLNIPVLFHQLCLYAIIELYVMNIKVEASLLSFGETSKSNTILN